MPISTTYLTRQLKRSAARDKRINYLYRNYICLNCEIEKVHRGVLCDLCREILLELFKTPPGRNQEEDINT